MTEDLSNVVQEFTVQLEASQRKREARIRDQIEREGTTISKERKARFLQIGRELQAGRA